MEKIPHHHEQSNEHEISDPSHETLIHLKHLEQDAHLITHKKHLEDELLSNIDHTDGLDAQEMEYIHIVEDFFDNFLDDRAIDDVSDDTKEMLIQRIQTHGYTIANLDALAQNIRHQSATIEGKTPQEKRQSIQYMLAASMGGYLMDQLDTAGHELPIHEQFAILAELQKFAETLDEEQKERKRKMRERLLADLFEWKNLEIYEVVIDASGRVIITIKNTHGERVTIAYNPADGTLSCIDIGAMDDIIPADQTKIAQVIESIRDQQSLPYDPEDTGTLLQFIS